MELQSHMLYGKMGYIVNGKNNKKKKSALIKALDILENIDCSTAENKIEEALKRVPPITILLKIDDLAKKITNEFIIEADEPEIFELQYKHIRKMISKLFRDKRIKYI